MPDNILATRKHDFYTARNNQIERNLACFRGGQPYIDLRLTRFPCEPEASWSGKAQAVNDKFWNIGQLDGIQGRKERAFLINYAGRIVTKYNQFIFGQDIHRAGIDETFADNATRTGLSINRTMRRLAGLAHAGGWAWLGVDRMASAIDPATGLPTQQSIADKARRGDRVFWSIWDATQVIDWEFDNGGGLAWLITEQQTYNSPNPRQAPIAEIVRTLWEPNEYTRLVIDPKSKEVKTETSGPVPAGQVPFIPAGIPTNQPHWFDDAERIQASLLNLESAHNENLIQAVFPQLVIPEELVQAVMEQAKVSYADAAELVRGLNYPILEPAESKGITRYIMPNGQDLKAIPDEILRRRRELFDIAGIGMQNKETRQAQSAESKGWDFLDTEATLRDFSQEWKETEEKAIEISRKIDSSFKDYTPVYPAEFDVSDVKSQMESLMMLQNMDLPDAGAKELLKASVALQSRIVKIDPERLEEIYAEIDAQDLEALAAAQAKTFM